MLGRTSICLITLVAILTCSMAATPAQETSKYPDWTGQWRIKGGNRWDPTKPPGRGQQAPLTAEYQKVFEASLADQRLGGAGNDPSSWCYPTGMPRLMTAIFAIEFVILPQVTHILFETRLPRRVFTDGRAWPKRIEPTFGGYSIGKWLDTDKDGRLDTLEIETRGFKGPRNFEPTGIPLHEDNQSVITERLWLDPANVNILNNEITTVDNALTRPWTVTKRYHRDRKSEWLEMYCNENAGHVFIGGETYFLSGDGLLMPQKKGQQPPDLRYFPQTQK
jgi:hypothetical protein